MDEPPGPPSKPRRKPRNRTNNKPAGSGSTPQVQPTTTGGNAINSGEDSAPRPSQAGNNRRQRFNAGLTPSTEGKQRSNNGNRHNHHRVPAVPLGMEYIATH